MIMPVQIAAATHSFSDPTGLLMDCHRRIESFITTLERVAAVIDRPPSEEVRQALETSLRYFRDAAAKHTADEEVSLFPRMRRLSDPDARAVMAELEKLEEEHRCAEPLHARVDWLGNQYLLNGVLNDIQIEEFRSSVARLNSMYRKHIHVEDTLVFPLATRTLSPHDKSAIASEMEERRGKIAGTARQQ